MPTQVNPETTSAPTATKQNQPQAAVTAAPAAGIGQEAKSAGAASRIETKDGSRNADAMKTKDQAKPVDVAVPQKTS